MKSLNICAFAFITSNMIQYACGLYYSHKINALKMKNTSHDECVVSKSNLNDKFNIEIKIFFVISMFVKNCIDELKPSITLPCS